MCRWSIRQLSVETGSLGYPKKARGFSERTTGGYNHSNPTEFSAEDFRDLETALTELQKASEAQFVTMMMYYKPWCVQAMRSEGWAFGNSTYFKRLHGAHKFVSEYMDLLRRSHNLNAPIHRPSL